MNSAALNQRTSPLLKLPGELRNRIYGYVLGKAEHWLVENPDAHLHAEGCSRTVFRIHVIVDEPNHLVKPTFGSTLMDVSRQIHEEAWTLLYARGTFKVRWVDSFYLWLVSLPGAARSAIASVDLGYISMPGRKDGSRMVAYVQDNHYLRTTFPQLDISKVIRNDPFWNSYLWDSVGDICGQLPGLQHLHLTIRVDWTLPIPSDYVNYQRLDTPYDGVERAEVVAQLRQELAKVFELPNVHVDIDLILNDYKEFEDHNYSD